MNMEHQDSSSEGELMGDRDQNLLKSNRVVLLMTTSDRYRNRYQNIILSLRM